MLTDAQREQVVACCRELVQAQSLAGREAGAAEVAERWMRRLGFDEVFVDSYGSVVGRVIGQAGDGPRLHFDGHLDTVPATALDEWRYPPFSATLAEGRIWGRGATDMKGPVAAMICAAAWLPRERLRGVVTVSASVAEEELEGKALEAILAERPADMVVIGESTRLRAGLGHKGRAGIRVTARGRPAHSSAPQDGDNAVYWMMAAIDRLRRISPPDDGVLGPGLMELVEIVSSPYPGTSIVPDRCTTRWDRRLVLGETREGVIGAVRNALAGLPQVEATYLDVNLPCYTGASLQAVDFHPAWLLDESSPLAQAALAGIAAAGLPRETCTVGYCTNGSGSAGRLGLPTIVLGPGDPARFHVVDEYLEVDELIRGVEVYQGLANALLGA